MDSGAGRDVVVVAASAGGVEALLTLLPLLPADLPAAILVVLHVPAAGGTALPGILGRAGLLPAAAAEDGQPLRPGHIYVAPPDHHLLVIDAAIRLSTGPRHQGHRPAADPLFFSAALTAGPRTIAVVLSGMLDDGAAGSAAVERRGGIVLIQDPAESTYGGMPRAALAATRHAKVLRLRQMAARINEESRPAGAADRGTGAAGPGRDLAHGHGLAPPGLDLAPGLDVARELDLAPALKRQLGIFLDPDHFPDWVQPADAAPPADSGQPPTAGPAAAGPAPASTVTCPACGRPLHRDDDSPARFDCLAGHAWPADSLAAAQAAAISRALWTAVSMLEEQARSSDLMADAAESHSQPKSDRNSRSAARTARATSVMIRNLLTWATRAGVTRPDSGGSA